MVSTNLQRMGGSKSILKLKRATPRSTTIYRTQAKPMVRIPLSHEKCKKSSFLRAHVVGKGGESRGCLCLPVRSISLNNSLISCVMFSSMTTLERRRFIGQTCRVWDAAPQGWLPYSAQMGIVGARRGAPTLLGLGLGTCDEVSVSMAVPCYDVLRPTPCGLMTGSSSWNVLSCWSERHL